MTSPVFDSRFAPPACLIPGGPGTSTLAGPHLVLSTDDDGSSTIMPLRARLVLPTPTPSDTPGLGLGFPEALMGLNSPFLPTKLSSLSLNPTLRRARLEVSGSRSIPSAQAARSFERDHTHADAYANAHSPIGSFTPRAPAPATPLKIAPPLPGTFTASKRLSLNQDLDTDAPLLQHVQHLPVHAPVPSRPNSLTLGLSHSLGHGHNLSLGMRLVASYEKMVARLSPSSSPSPSPPRGRGRVSPCSTLEVQVSPHARQLSESASRRVGEGAGRRSEGRIDELAVEWCVLCGAEGDVEHMKLARVRPGVLRSGLDAWGQEQGRGRGHGEEVEVEGWVCGGTCRFGRL